MEAEKKFTRIDVYELVWSVKMHEAAAALGMKIWHLTYLCERHRIPRPLSGHWTKVRLGRAEPRPELEPSEEDGKAIVTIKDEKLDRWLRLDADFRERAEALLARENDPKFAITFKPTLRGCHPVVSATRERLIKYSEDPLGKLHASGSECFEVKVTKAQLQRALLLLDAFAKGCQRRGYRLEPQRGRQYGSLCVVILGKEVEIRLTEKVRRQDKPKSAKRDRWDYHKYAYVSTGVLTLALGGYELSDTPEKPLEEAMREAMVLLVESAMDLRLREIEEGERRKREMEAERKRRELRRLQEEEGARVKKLHEEVDCWVRSRQIREYVQALRAHVVQKDGLIEPGGKVDLWSAWALEQADRMDPLAPTPYSVLDEPVPAY